MAFGKKIVYNTTIRYLLKTSIVAFLLIFIGFDAAGYSQTFYYKATASASPARAGKVYLNTSNSNNPTYSESVDLGTQNKSATGLVSKPTSTTVTFYLKAKADSEDYNLVTWKRGSTQIRQALLNNGLDAFDEQMKITSTSESSPTTFVYTANFAKTYVTATCDGVNCLSATVAPLLNTMNTNVTLTAVLSPGFFVKYWKNKNTGEIVESSRQDENIGKNPWTFKVWEEATYEPVLDESWVTASSANTSSGTVTVSPSNNFEGDEVTLLAVPKSGFYNVEWRKKGETEVVSTENPLKLTVTEKAEYVATFVPSTDVLTDGYYRVYSPNPSTAKSDISLVDNLFNMHAIVGSVSSFLSNSALAVGRAQGQLAQDINLQTPSVASTMTNSVVYLKKVGGQYDFYAQGTHIKELSTGAFYGDNAGKVSSSGAYLDLARAGACYLMSLTVAAYAHNYSQTQNMGPFYFSDSNGKFTVLEEQDAHSLWVIEPMDFNDNYFAVQPDASLCFSGHYFTSLRTPFPYQIPAGSLLKAYGVAQISSENGGEATLQTYSAGDIVPAGMPVVIESPSLQIEDNKLVPTGDPTDAISTNSSYTVATALYNNYGAHRHDHARKLEKAGYVDDIPMSGDQVGYFVMNPDYTDNIPSPVCYELALNENGEIGFWNQVQPVTKKVNKTNVTYYPIDGTKAYSTTPCALFPKAKTPVIELDKTEAYTTEGILATITTATSGATILYSLDGGETWTEYAEPVAITQESAGEYTILAKASKAGYIDSDIATATYTFVAGEYSPVTLANLIASGDTEGKYIITDLTAVDVVGDELIICKDDNGYANPDAMPNPIPEGETWVDYIAQSKASIEEDLDGREGGPDVAVPATYDQSNWIALHLLEGQYVTSVTDWQGRRLSGVKGRLLSATNPEFQLDAMPTPDESATIKPNVYVAASFNGDNHQQGTKAPFIGTEYFFVQPKPMELATIGWAQWDAANEQFVVPANENQPEWNTAGLSGHFGFNGSLLEQEGYASLLQDGHSYLMPALIKYKVGGNSQPASAPRRAGEVAKEYVAYPLRLVQTTKEVNGVITGVTAIGGSRAVAGVDYYNLAGQRSSRLWQGVNIVVTRYTDGTTSTCKQIKN